MCAFLKDRLPIWEVAADHIVSTIGAVTMAFELTMPEIFTLSAPELEAFHQTWNKGFGVLLPDTIIHIQHWYWRTQWQPNKHKANTWLGKASDAHFEGRPWLDQSSTLYITKRPKRKGFDPGRTLMQNRLTPPDTLSDEAIQQFTATVSQFIQILSDSKLITIRRLSTEDLVSSRDGVGKIEQYCQLLKEDDNPVLGDISFTNGIRIGGKYGILHTIADAQQLPAELGPTNVYKPYSSDGISYWLGSASTLGQLLPHNHIVNCFILIEEPATIRKDLEIKGRRMQSLAPHSRENQLGKAAVEDYLNEAGTGQHQLVKAHVNVFSFTDDPSELSSIENATASAITRAGVVPHLETVGAAQIWGAGIPGNAADLPLYEMFDCFTAHALCFIIPDGLCTGSHSDHAVRFGDRIYGRPVELEMSDEPMQYGLISNRNKFILGGSG